MSATPRDDEPGSASLPEPRQGRIVTFGEALFRLSPAAGIALERAEAVTLDLAGAEANVAVALARLGERATWVSHLPDNALGRRAANKLREHGVDLAHVTFVPDSRMGLYFVELAAAPRRGQVIYDRRASAFACMDADGFPPAALDDATLLHLTGITPALGAGPRAACDRAAREACRRGIPISFDVNYRSTLCSPSTARAICDEIAVRAGILFVNRRDVVTVLGLDGSAEEQISALKARYPHALCVMTMGAAGAYVYDEAPLHEPAVKGIEIDRVGRGDAFCAGFLWGHARGGAAYGAKCGVALAALKQTYAGDFAWSTRSDLLACLDALHELPR